MADRQAVGRQVRRGWSGLDERRVLSAAPLPVADRVGLARCAAHKMLVRCRRIRLSHTDRVTGEPIRRYE